MKLSKVTLVEFLPTYLPTFEKFYVYRRKKKKRRKQRDRNKKKEKEREEIQGG